MHFGARIPDNFRKDRSPFFTAWSGSKAEVEILGISRWLRARIRSGRGSAGGASVGGHLDLVGRLGLRRGHGRRRRSHHLVPKRRHPRGPRRGGFPLLQHSRRALRPKSSAGGAVESDTRADSLPVVVCTDSMAALARVRSGPAAQRAPVAAAIWELLRPLADRGQPVYMQWVPAHSWLQGNERADVLAREASALPQHMRPASTPGPSRRP